MVHFNLRVFLITLLSGALAAGLSLTSAVASPIAFLAPLPIFVSAFRSGAFAGLFSTMIALTLLSYYFPDVQSFIHVGLFHYAPTVLTAWLLLQQRETECFAKVKSHGVSFQFLESYFICKKNQLQTDQKTTPQTKNYIWYPLSSVLLWLIIFIAFGCFVILQTSFTFAPTLIQMIQQELTQAFTTAVTTSELAQKLTAENIETSKTFLIHAIPHILWGLIGFSTFLCIVFNIVVALWLKNKIFNQNTTRPMDYLPAAFRLPFTARFIFLLTIIALSFFSFSETTLSIFSTLIGAFLAGFFISGLATIHYLLREKEWKHPVLSGFYCLLFLSLFYGTGSIFMGFFLFFIMLIGLFSQQSGILPLSNK